MCVFYENDKKNDFICSPQTLRDPNSNKNNSKSRSKMLKSAENLLICGLGSLSPIEKLSNISVGTINNFFDQQSTPLIFNLVQKNEVLESETEKNNEKSEDMDITPTHYYDRKYY